MRFKAGLRIGVVGMAALVGVRAAQAEDVFVPACPPEVPGCVFGADLQEALDLAEEGGTVWVTADLETPELDTGDPDVSLADGVTLAVQDVRIAGWSAVHHSVPPLASDGIALTLEDLTLSCGLELSGEGHPAVLATNGALALRRTEASGCLGVPAAVVDATQSTLSIEESRFDWIYGDSMVFGNALRGLTIRNSHFGHGDRGIVTTLESVEPISMVVEDSTFSDLATVGLFSNLQSDATVRVSSVEFQRSSTSVQTGPNLGVLSGALVIVGGAEANVGVHLSDVRVHDADLGVLTGRALNSNSNADGHYITLIEDLKLSGTFIRAPLFVLNAAEATLRHVDTTCIATSPAVPVIVTGEAVSIENSTLGYPEALSPITNYINELTGQNLASPLLVWAEATTLTNNVFLPPPGLPAVVAMAPTEDAPYAVAVHNSIITGPQVLMAVEGVPTVKIVDSNVPAGADPANLVSGATASIQGLLLGDAGFQLGSGDSCEDFDLHLLPDSPLRDAGDPDTAFNDPDGSRNDIGAYGGPGADLVDADLDGVFDDLDCDEAEPTIYYGADEVPWDDIDQDCDGADLIDVDQDGFVALQANGDDCDDEAAGVHPGATDVPYDGIDQNCDGKSELDLDGDGAIGALAGGTDCDDTDPTIHPGAVEAWYDRVDQNCDGNDLDRDLDGHNVPFDVFLVAVEGGDDCNDLQHNVHPGEDEVWYDGTDQDCDGNDLDQDGDGYDSADHGGTDCDDQDELSFPGAEDPFYDGIDSDCEGNDDLDQDGDGDRLPAFGGGDCDDQDPLVASTLPEVWYDGVDQDCDGNDLDQDGDGHDSLFDGDGDPVEGGSDCNDLKDDISPQATEVWYDGVDQDCDGNDSDQDGDGHDSPEVGGDDCDDTDPKTYPGAFEDFEVVDRDCDGWGDPSGPVTPRDCGACSQSGLSSGWWPLMVASLAALRRRGRTDGATA